MKKQTGEILEFQRRFPVVSAQKLGLNEASDIAFSGFFRAC